MLHSLDSSFPNFLHIDFSPGVNVILAEGNLTTNKTGTANSVGKSSVFRLIDFIFGGNLNDKELPTEVFAGHKFVVEATICKRRVRISRAVDREERGYVEVEGQIDGWPHVTAEEVNAPEQRRKFKIKHWLAILGACNFDLPMLGPDGTAKSNKAPTPREMFNLFNRKSFNDINKAHPRQGTEKGRLATAYLLGLNWEYLVDLAKFKKDEQLVKSIEETAKFELEKTRTDRAKLERENKALEARIQEAEAAMAHFEVDLSYSVIESRVDELTSRLRSAQRRATNARQRVALAEKAKAAIADNPEELVQFYETMKLDLGEMVKRRLVDVKRFHDQVQANRLAILDAEIVAQLDVAKAAEQESDACDKERAELVRSIEGQSVTLADFRDKQNALAELRAKLERNIGALKLFADAAAEKKRIDDLRMDCAAKAKITFAANSANVDQMAADFKELVESMYTGSQGQLQVDFYDGSVLVGKKKPYDIVVTASVSGDNGSGKAHMKVCAFDLLAFAFSRKVGRGIDFLMHDTPAFEASDSNQISHLVLRADKVMHENGGQYIYAIDKDRYDLCREGNEDFAALAKNANVIKLSESRKLFGVNFG